MSIGIPPIVVILGALACVAAVLVVVIASRRQADTTFPRCGNCGYNLTGAPANRCPECGLLFVEAGVITKPPPSSPPRYATRTMVLVAVGLTLLAVLGIVAMRMQALAATAQAIAARQAAVQAQQQALVQRAAATAPAVEGSETDQPSRTP